MNINEFLKSRGVEDPKHYRNLTWDDVNDPTKLRNIKEAATMLKKHIKDRTPIRILVDTDVDGYTSAVMLYLSLEWMNHIGRGELVKYILHDTNKSHGLAKQDMDLLLEDNTLLIIPDAGTNDDDSILAINEKIDICVLDHHPRELKSVPPFVLVNPQTSDGYTNKQLSGAGVVWQFIRYYTKGKLDYSYSDLMAIALIADVMDIRSYETKFLITYGLSDIRNPFLRFLVRQTENKTNGVLSIRNIQMYIVPLMNAIIRVGTLEERDLLFKAFCSADESLHKQAFELADKCKARQDMMINDWIVEQDFSEFDKVIVMECSLPDGIAGVAAQKVLSKTGKSTILFPDEDKEHGHARGKGNFKTLCNESKLCTAIGHEQAFGVDIEHDKKSALMDFLNSQQIVNEDRKPDIIESDSFVFDAANLNPLVEFNEYVGTGIEPLILELSESIFSPDSISIIGKKKDTLKIAFEDQVNLMIFFYTTNSDLVEKVKRIKKEKKHFSVKARCSLSRSEYFGKRSWSLIAEEYEVNIIDAS